MSYSEVTISGYNSSPPADDGSTGPTNQVKWATIKGKLFDPLRTAVELIDDRASSAITTADSTQTTTDNAISALSTQVTNLSVTLSAPSGTSMLFAQTAAPTGWNKGATYDDYALRLVTGTASTGGSTAFSEVFTARTIDEDNLPVHTHDYSDNSSVSFTGTTSFITNVNENSTTGQGGGSQNSYIDDVNEFTDSVEGSWDFEIDTGNTGSGGTWDFDIQYVDVILATKS